MMDKAFVDQKLTLRVAQLRDTDDIFRWENDKDNWLVSNTTEPYTRAEIESFLLTSNNIQGNLQQRFMIETEQKAVIGCIDLFDFDKRNRRAGVGILIDKHQRGKGYASQSLNQLSKHAFESLELDSLYAEIPENNTHSRQLFLSCGFEHTATKKKWLWDGEKYLDQLFLQRFRDEG